MTYLQEEKLFKEEGDLEAQWGDPIVLIYSDIVTVSPQENYSSYYLPFFYKNKKIIFTAIDY